MDTEKKEFGKWWMWILLLIVISFPVIAGLKYAEVIGKTIVERKVFEQSYQRSESMKSRELAYQAQLAQINSKLSSNLSDTDKADLESQKAMLETQINLTRGIK